MEPADGRLSQLARKVVEPLGYELVAVEFFQRGASGATLRVYIDHPKGIGLDDCEVVSEQLGAVLDVEEPLQGRYDLEVSSPGLDRPLVDPAHFKRFSGERAKVRLIEKIDGRRSLEGVIAGCEDGILSLDADGRRWQIPLDGIEIARLVPDL
jgi:ribosome maturation factor RimP